MTLADLRKLSIRKQYRIRFVLPNGMECVVTEHGIARLPALKGLPDFNLESEFATVGEFLLEPAAAPGRKGAPQSRSVSREELAAMTGAGGSAAPGHDDREDE